MTSVRAATAYAAWHTARMAPEDRDKDEPSLELPSLGFRRRRSQADPVEAAPEAEAATEDWAPEQVTGPLAEPRTAPADHPAHDSDRDRFEPVGEGTPAPDAETTVVSEPDTEPVTEPAEEPADQTRVLEPEEPPTRRRGIVLPAIGALPATVVTGVLVGFITVGLTWASLQMCTLVKDTPSCGSPGVFLLLVVFIVMVYLGAALLRAFRVRDPGSTSFLGMALLAVVVMAFLLGSLEEWWTVIVIPVVGAMTYGLSQWVTSRFVEPGDRPR
jgi:hypothetical protein